MEKKVIFTDLDGTLLDDKYSFKKAEPGIEITKHFNIPLIFVSSKTRAEIEVYRKKTKNNHPFISENGGAIFIPQNYFAEENKNKLKKKYKIIELGTKYSKLVQTLKKIKKKIPLRGFSQMSAKELSKNSGLNLKQAKLAKKREYDEAFELENKKDEKQLFQLIKKHKLKYTKGGRYYHILGNNNKGKAVKILSEFYKNKYGKIETIALGDSDNDKPMLKKVKKPFLIKSPNEWSKIVIELMDYENKLLKKGDELYWKSIEVLKKMQLKNGAILASFPKGRYPYVYPRDHAICILGLISAGLYKEAKKALQFVLKGQNSNGSFPQRMDKKAKDKSYKPIQIDNTGLTIYAFAKYIQETKDKEFLAFNKLKIEKAVKYLKSKLHEKNLFYTPNSIHEFPPYEAGYEIWSNSVCLSALEELKKIRVKTFPTKKIKQAIEKYFWGEDSFVKTIRIAESSSVADDIDASTYAIADFDVLGDNNSKVKKTVKEIIKELWHDKLGGICRYKEYIGRNNGGYGPWPHFTLMIARHFIKLKNKKKAEIYLNWIIEKAHKNLLPEHIALKEDFEEWVSEYKKAGIMRKDREIMLKNIRKSEPYKTKGLAYSVLPLAWPHAEFIRTWNLYRDVFYDN